MPFEPKTFSPILQRMVDRVVARSELTDVVPGGQLHTELSAFAREMDDYYVQASKLQDAWDVDTATGDELDLRAEDIPGGILVRGGAAKASLTVVFTRSGTVGEATIPTGTVVSVPGGPSYATIVDGAIADGDTASASISALAIAAGADGNTNVGTVSTMSGLAGVETVANTTAGTGGSDAETDDELRQRIIGYYASLARSTPDALHYAALGTTLDGFGRVVSVQVLNFPSGIRGLVHLFIDNGTGTIETTDDNTGSPESVILNATGGERRLYLANIPIHTSFARTISINAVPITEGVDYRFYPDSGLIILDETLYPTGLVALDDVTAEYTWYTGLVAEVQKIVNGDPDDRVNYPGYAAAGVQVLVLAPATTQLAIEGVVTPDITFGGLSTDLKDQVKDAWVRYVNGLGIGEDVILTELIHQAQSVPGVRDVAIISPPSNVTVGEGELIRLTVTNIDIL